MKLQLAEWKPNVMCIASFSEPLKCLHSLQILPSSVLKVVIKSFFLKFALLIFLPKSQHRHPWPETHSLTSLLCSRVHRSEALETAPGTWREPTSCSLPLCLLSAWHSCTLEAILIFSIILHSVQTRLLTVLQICCVSFYLSWPSVLSSWVEVLAILQTLTQTSPRFH